VNTLKPNPGQRTRIRCFTCELEHDPAVLQTRAYGLRVPAPPGGYLCLRALRDTGGTAIAVGEAGMEAATRELAAQSGVDIYPEGGAAWAALSQLRSSGWIRNSDNVVLFNTGTGLKYR
jgi:threonine synthase